MPPEDEDKDKTPLERAIAAAAAAREKAEGAGRATSAPPPGATKVTDSRYVESGKGPNGSNVVWEKQGDGWRTSYTSVGTYGAGTGTGTNNTNYAVQNLTNKTAANANAPGYNNRDALLAAGGKLIGEGTIIMTNRDKYSMEAGTGLFRFYGQASQRDMLDYARAALPGANTTPTVTPNAPNALGRIPGMPATGFQMSITGAGSPSFPGERGPDGRLPSGPPVYAPPAAPATTAIDPLRAATPGLAGALGSLYPNQGPVFNSQAFRGSVVPDAGMMAEGLRSMNTLSGTNNPMNQIAIHNPGLGFNGFINKEPGQEAPASIGRSPAVGGNIITFNTGRGEGGSAYTAPANPFPGVNFMAPSGYNPSTGTMDNGTWQPMSMPFNVSHPSLDPLSGAVSRGGMGVMTIDAPQIAHIGNTGFNPNAVAASNIGLASGRDFSRMDPVSQAVATAMLLDQQREEAERAAAAGGGYGGGFTPGGVPGMAKGGTVVSRRPTAIVDMLTGRPIAIASEFNQPEVIAVDPLGARGTKPRMMAEGGTIKDPIATTTVTPWQAPTMSSLMDAYNKANNINQPPAFAPPPVAAPPAFAPPMAGLPPVIAAPPTLNELMNPTSFRPPTMQDILDAYNQTPGPVGAPPVTAPPPVAAPPPITGLPPVAAPPIFSLDPRSRTFVPPPMVDPNFNPFAAELLNPWQGAAGEIAQQQHLRDTYQYRRTAAGLGQATGISVLAGDAPNDALPPGMFYDMRPQVEGAIKNIMSRQEEVKALGDTPDPNRTMEAVTDIGNSLDDIQRIRDLQLQRVAVEAGGNVPSTDPALVAGWKQQMDSVQQSIDYTVAQWTQDPAGHPRTPQSEVEVSTWRKQAAELYNRIQAAEQAGSGAIDKTSIIDAEISALQERLPPNASEEQLRTQLAGLQEDLNRNKRRVNLTSELQNFAKMGVPSLSAPIRPIDPFAVAA